MKGENRRQVKNRERSRKCTAFSVPAIIVMESSKSDK